MSTTYGRPQRQRPGVIASLAAMTALVGVMWALEVVDQVSRGALDAYGIEPRQADDLWTVFTAPWLHGSFGHLASNSLPFILLGALVLMDGWGRWLVTTLVVVLVSGAAVWLLSPVNSVTLGASGLVFGYLVYVVLRGLWTRSPGQVATGVVVFLVYGGLLWGVLPQSVGVSWQAHLGGAIGGLIAAGRAGRDRAPATARW